MAKLYAVVRMTGGKVVEVGTVGAENQVQAENKAIRLYGRGVWVREAEKPKGKE